MKKNNLGFTLIEIILGVLIFTIVIIAGFQALSAIGIGKVKLLEKTAITKDITFFTERLFEEIKGGGTIDYEEYFNRSVVGTGLENGHFKEKTGFGNFGATGIPGTSTYGNTFYYCRSEDGVNMGTGGCVNSFNTLGNQSWKSQRYGQYAFQFIDYNSNMNGDGGDEDGDGDIRGDDDDEHLGEGPVVFDANENVKEIYLISGDKKTRTFFRWSWKGDEKSPDGGESCGNENFNTGSCIGTIEMLKLSGEDWGLNHDLTATSTGASDGIIDTWRVQTDFASGEDNIIAGSSADEYRQPLFPDTMSVSDFKVYLYPNIDTDHAWKDVSEPSNINPYLRMSITLEPSWKKRAMIQGETLKYQINTTINLVDYFTQ